MKAILKREHDDRGKRGYLFSVKQCYQIKKNRGEAIEMSIFEYDEERELKLIRRAEYEEGLKEGREAGLKQGRLAAIKNLVAKKLEKGKTAEQIAEDLEEEVSVIEQLMENLSHKENN